MKVSPSLILPSQDYLKPDSIKFIYQCINSGRLNELLPPPIVRRDKDGNLIAIDGHNLIAVKLHRGEDIEVHLAKLDDDGLPETNEANIKRNIDLKKRFNSVIEDRARTKAKGIEAFADLIELNRSLFPKLEQL
jgi:hypothetical protein